MSQTPQHPSNGLRCPHAVEQNLGLGVSRDAGESSRGLDNSIIEMSPNLGIYALTLSPNRFTLQLGKLLPAPY